MTRRIEIPHPSKPRSFAQQMALEPLGASSFRSLAGALSMSKTRDPANGEQRARAFGGHVYAQAVYAASKTVPAGFQVHSVTGYFTILGFADEPFTYRVRTIRTGGNYAVRQVDVVQEDGVKICFTNICSFKRAQNATFQAQVKADVKKRFLELSGGKNVDELPLKQANQSLPNNENQNWITSVLPGILTTVSPLNQLFKNQKPMDRKSIFVYTSTEDENDPTLDACVHLFHSDRESIYSGARQYQLFDKVSAMASLSHTVIFHTSLDHIRFRKQDKKKWYYHEICCNRFADGRVLHEGTVHDEDGNHLISTMQDGSIRLNFSSDQERIDRENKVIEDSKI